MSVDKFKFISPAVEMAEIDNTALPTIGTGTGPLLIGRAKRGPVMVPVRVKSQSEFVEIFGEPVSGTATGDVWREGDVCSPMYSAYAAYAYLKNKAPVTFLRLAGWEHPSRTDSYGEAGWKTLYTEISSNDPTAYTADDVNGGAYGLFIMDKYPQTAGVTTGVTIAGVNSATITMVGENDDCMVADGVQVRINTAAATDTYDYTLDGGSTWVNNGGGGFPISAALTPIQLGSSAFYVTWAAVTGGAVAPDADLWVLSLSHSDMVLAAKFYCNNGALALKGTQIGGTVPADGTAAASLVRSVGSNYEFDMKVFDATWNNAGVEDTDAELETIRFNFNRSSSRYIRKVFNTNPTLVNGDITTTANTKTYWLGETYDQFLYDSLSATTGASAQVAAVLKIESDGSNVGSGADYRYGAQDAESGWVFAQDLSADYALYDADNMQKLFKIYSRGDTAQNIKVSIDNIRYSSFSGAAYGRFDVIVRKAEDTDKKIQALETFAGCTLNPNDPNYVGRKIGNRYISWDETTLRYKSYGKYANRSKYIRLEMDQGVESGSHNQYCLPWGYYGKPVYYDIAVDTTGAGLIGLTGDNWLRGGEKDVGLEEVYLPFATSATDGLDLDDDGVAILSTIKDAIVKLRADSTDGGVINYKNSFWGLYTNRVSGDRFDSSYYDLVKPKSIMANGTAGTADGMKYSHKFTLDDVRFYNPGATGVATRATYASGNRVAGTSITAGEESDGTTTAPSYALVCDAGFARFTMELVGGFNGMDVTEKDAFRNERLAANGGAEILNYTMYTMNSALNIVKDPDLVDYNLLAVCGITSNEVNGKIIDVCESRSDAIGVIDTEGQYVPSHENDNAEEDRVGSVAGAITTHLSYDIDSNYATTFFNWPQIIDSNNNSALLYVPPSVAAIDTFGASEKLTAIWYAAAGYTRGNLSSGITGLNYVDVLFTLNKDDRDDLYEANMNPIVAKPEGILVFGNKTLQQIPSALDRINVRRLMIHLKKEIANIASTVLFDSNIEVTWNRFVSKAEPLLSSIVVGGGLEKYKIVFDKNTTTPDLVDRNIIYGKIYVTPVKVAEFIGIDFILTKSGVGFDD